MTSRRALLALLVLALLWLAGKLIWAACQPLLLLFFLLILSMGQG